jgi:hypothetical protein
VIQFPSFGGDAGIGQVLPKEWHTSILAADEPFEIAASGAQGKDVKVTFYADLEPLKTKAQGNNPYRVSAEGLPPGLHVLYAVTSIDRQEEISRPVTVMFHRRTNR